MRRTVEAPYVRGEATRARILDVAIALFAARGFDSVSTREIAAAAAVPQASLRYYFENKQRLYIVCLEQIYERIFRQMEPAVKASEALLESPDTTIDQIIDSFCTLQEAMVDALVGSDGGNGALLTLRHDLPSAAGSENLSGDQTRIRRLSSCFSQMMVRISWNRLDEQAALRLTGLINGQVTNVTLRRTRLSHEGWDITAERLLWIKQMIRENSTAILQAHRPENR